MTRADKLVMVVVLVAVVVLGGSLWLLKTHSLVMGVPQVVIEVDGKVQEQFPLTKLKPGEQHQIKGVIGYSTIVGGENRVQMVDSPCPDKICVGMGWIEHPGEAIVCLPNRIVVRIAGTDNAKLDGVSQ